MRYATTINSIGVITATNIVPSEIMVLLPLKVLASVVESSAYTVNGVTKRISKIAKAVKRVFFILNMVT